MTLGFSVNELLPFARGGGTLRMGVQKLAESEWLQPNPDLAARKAAFDAHPDSVVLAPECDGPAAELSEMLGIAGGLEDCARGHWEDMCLLVQAPGEAFYRMVGAAVAFPTDWHPAQKLGLSLAALHEPIHGYAEQLASGVDHFMAGLKPGKIFGRANWFIAPTGNPRWIADAPPDRAFAHVTGDNAGDTLFVRSERQTLRRLPHTGAILFTIGVYQAPLRELSAANLGRIANAVGSLIAGEGARRGAPHYADALLTFAARHPIEKAA